MFLTLPRASLVAVALATSSVSHAATELAPVTAAASRLPGIVEQLPVGTLTLTQDDIRNSTATNLADLLDSIAGVETRRLFGLNGSRASVDMLGFGPTGNDNVLVLLNGRRINAPDLSELNLSLVPRSAIERIEVLPGAGSVLYGEGATGGVINIVTRDEYQDGGGAILRGGDYDTLGGSVWASTGQDDISLMASAESLDSLGYRDNNEIRQRSGFLDLRRNGEGLDWNLTLVTNDERIGLPGPRGQSPGNNDLEEDPTGTSSPSDWAREDGYSIMPGLAFDLSKQVRFNLDLSSRERNRSAYYQNFFYYEESELKSWSVSPRLTALLETGPVFHTLTLGSDILDDKLLRPSSSSPATISDPSYQKNVRRDESSQYIHDVMQLGEQWSVTLGARQTTLETRSYTFFAPNFESEFEKRDTLEMYQAGLQFRPQPELAIFLNGEKSARLPNADEVASGNPEPLEPQTGKLVTTGMRWGSEGQRSTLTLWYGKFKDEILFLQSTPFCCNVNLDDQTRRRGVTLNSRFRLDDSLWLTVNASRQEARFAEGALRGNDLPLVPKVTAYAQFDWQATGWLTASLSRRYVGERRLDGDLDNSSDRLDAYDWTDLVLRGERGNWHASAGVYNLEDALVYDSGIETGPDSFSAYPLPDRHFMAEIGVQW